MLGEWIKLLGLDCYDPPWDGKPKEIRGLFSLNGDLVQVKLLDVIEFGKRKEAFIEYCEKVDEEASSKDLVSRIWVDISEIYQIAVIY